MAEINTIERSKRLRETANLLLEGKQLSGMQALLAATSLRTHATSIVAEDERQRVNDIADKMNSES